jgi:hypothetical protein
VNKDPSPGRLERSILRTVAYSDVFDFPLTDGELHRYLDTVSASPAAVAGAARRLVGSTICSEDGMVALADRGELFAVRRRREVHAARLWPAARRWGRILGRLPLVRMVALTGALAMDNVEADADIDYLIVTEPGRVWLCRAMVIQLVRAARLTGIVVCPNWLLAANAVELGDRSLFVARELAQMVPLVGVDAYRRMRRLNRWTEVLLPNAVGPPRPGKPTARRRGPLTVAAEAVLLSRTGAIVETWERRRKTREILGSSPGSPEVVLDTHQCKGHVDAHGERIRHAYADRLRALDLEPSVSAPSAAAT